MVPVRGGMLVNTRQTGYWRGKGRTEGGGVHTSFRYAVMNWERMLDVAESRQADIVAWTMGEAGAMIGDRSLELYKSGSMI
jgi:hypothetical protein